MGWFYVFLAAVAEIIGAAGLKMYSEKKTLKNWVLFVGGFASAFIFLYQSFHYLQLTIAYSVWIGVGTAGAVLINMFLFGESKSWGRLLSVSLIIVGLVGLKSLS